MMNIRGIILAGGSSKRMGSNKLMMDYKGKPIIQWTMENARNSGLNEVVVVYGEYEIDTDIPVIKVYNPRHMDGMSTSIKEGLNDFQGDGVMLLLGDMPLVTSEIINLLLESFTLSGKSITVPMNKGKRGNPVIIGRKYFQSLRDNMGDKGARDIISSNIDDVEYIEVDSECIFQDVDDRSTYEKLVK